VPNNAAKAQLNSSFVAANLVPIVTAAQAGLPESLAFADKNNFAPRVGLAYKLTADNKTVVRTAYGIFYDHLEAPVWLSIEGGPYAGSASAPPNSITNGVPLWQLPAMFPSVLNQSSTASLAGLDPHLRLPYIQQWNFTLEREVAHIGLRASYMGTKAEKLVMMQDLNQLQPSTIPFSASRRPFPQLSTVSYSSNAGTSLYNGLVLSLERRLRNGFGFQSSYTWAKNLTDDQSEAETGAQPENSYDRRAEWGNNAYTRRHRVNFSLQYELPFGAGHAHGARFNRLVGGWSISAFGMFQTGPYFTPSFDGSDPSNTGAGGGRSDCIGNPSLANATIQNWFNASAFAVPPESAGRFGNCGVNILRGPGTEVVDLGFFKQIAIKENLKFRLEGTFTNALNHPNFGVPNSLITSSSVGIIQATQSYEGAGARTARVGLRLDW
jgi:hypothetical protein